MITHIKKIFCTVHNSAMYFIPVIIGQLQNCNWGNFKTSSKNILTSSKIHHPYTASDWNKQLSHCALGEK